MDAIETTDNTVHRDSGANWVSRSVIVGREREMWRWMMMPEKEDARVMQVTHNCTTALWVSAVHWLSPSLTRGAIKIENSDALLIRSE